jgi:chemotaxis signal transduction protein
MTAAAAVQQALPDRLPRWLLVRCADRDVALALDQVREIIEPVPVTRLPGAGPEVHGLIGHRGRAVTTLDLGVAFGAARPVGPDHRLILIERGARMVALAVDGIDAVADADCAALSADDHPADTTDASGWIVVDGGRRCVLDVARLLERLLS